MADEKRLGARRRRRQHRGMHRSSWVTLGSLLVFFSSTEPAHAFEGQWRGGASVGANLSPQLDVGPQVAVHAGYGLADAIELRMEALGALHPGEQARRDVLRLGLGVLYKFDVTRWVPYVGLGAAYAWVVEPPSSGALIEPFVGLEYLWSRALGCGLEYRLAAFDDEAIPSPVQQLMIRFEHSWGW